MVNIIYKDHKTELCVLFNFANRTQATRTVKGGIESSLITVSNTVLHTVNHCMLYTLYMYSIQKAMTNLITQGVLSVGLA